MPTREEVFAKLPPDKQKLARRITLIEASTFTTRDLVEDRLYRLDEADQDARATGLIPEESLDESAICRQVARALIYQLLKEWGDTPTTAQITTTLAYVISVIGISSLQGEQTAVMVEMLKSAIQTLSQHMIAQTMADIFEPKPATNN